MPATVRLREGDEATIAATIRERLLQAAPLLDDFDRRLLSLTEIHVTRWWPLPKLSMIHGQDPRCDAAHRELWCMMRIPPALEDRFKDATYYDRLVLAIQVASGHPELNVGLVPAHYWADVIGLKEEADAEECAR